MCVQQWYSYKCVGRTYISGTHAINHLAKGDYYSTVQQIQQCVPRVESTPQQERIPLLDLLQEDCSPVMGANSLKFEKFHLNPTSCV